MTGPGPDAPSAACPRCGGARLRELTPGFYECTSPVDASMPPGAAGNAGWMHASRPCGHRFQLGPAAATEPCACGRHSIGRCRGCDRPLCGLHGTAEGELLCEACVAARQRRRQAADAAAAATRRDGLAARARDLTARVADCADAHALQALLADRGGAVPDPEALRAAWTRAVAGDAWPAARHELVALSGRPTLGSPLSWNDFKRRGRWSETGRRSVVWQAPEGAFSSDLGHTNCDAWLDANGGVWFGAFPETLGFGKHEGPKTRHFVLPRGERVTLRRGVGTYESYHIAPGSLVQATSPDPAAYARVVELALRHGL